MAVPHACKHTVYKAGDAGEGRYRYFLQEIYTSRTAAVSNVTKHKGLHTISISML